MRTFPQRVEKKILRILQKCVAPWARWVLNKKGLVDIFLKRPESALTPNYVDLWNIYRLIRKHKPRSVLEIGGGCSTFVIAKALEENIKQNRDKSDVQFFCIDNESEWVDALKKQIHEEHLDHLVTVIHSPILEVSYKDVLVWKYSILPIVNPDFIYLDGPSFTEDRQITINPLEIESDLKQGAIILVDNRRKNALFLRDNFKRKWVTKFDWLRGNTEFYLKK